MPLLAFLASASACEQGFNRERSCRDCINKARSARIPNYIGSFTKNGSTAIFGKCQSKTRFPTQVAEKHVCPACPVALADGTGVSPEDRTGGGTEPMVWFVALESKDDLERFKELKWGLRTWDLWNWNDCLPVKFLPR